MTMWAYLPSKRVSPAQARAMPNVKKCTACVGDLLRLAERDRDFPYRWIPNGWICGSCNAVFLVVA